MTVEYPPIAQSAAKTAMRARRLGCGAWSSIEHGI
jgi:hypothetical protein